MPVSLLTADHASSQDTKSLGDVSGSKSECPLPVPLSLSPFRGIIAAASPEREEERDEL